MNPPSIPALLEAARAAATARWAVLLSCWDGEWDVPAQVGLSPAGCAALADSAPALLAARPAAAGSEFSIPASLQSAIPFKRAVAVPATAEAFLVLGDHRPRIAAPAWAALRGIAAALGGLVQAERMLVQARQSRADSALLTEARRRADELAVLSRVGQSFLGTLDMEELLGRLMAEIRLVVEAEAASILLWDDADQALTFATADSPNAGELVGLRVPPGQGIAGWVAQHRQPVVVNDVRADSRWYPRVDEAIAFQSRSVACVPILRGSQLVGVLEAVNKRGGDFQAKDVELLEALSSWAGEAIANVRAFEAQQRQRETAESLAQLTSIAAATLELPSVLARVLDQLLSLVNCAEAWIALRAGDEMRVAAARRRQPPGADDRRLGLRINLQGDAGAAEVLRTRRPALLPPQSGQPARMLLPLAIGERLIGQIAFERPAPPFAPHEAEAIAGLGQPAAAAIENAQLYAEATRRLQEMTILHEVALATSTTLEPDELLRRTTQTLYHSANYERVVVLLAAAGDRLTLHPASVGLPFAQMAAELEFGQGAVGLAAHTGQPQRVDDARRDPRFVPLSLDGPTGSQLAVPLLAGDRVNGVLALESPRPAAFGAEDERLLTIVARQLATALDNSRLFAAVRERAVNLTVLSHVARQIVGALDAGEIIRRAVAELSERFDYALAAVFLLEADGHSLALRGLAGAQEARIPAGRAWRAEAGIVQRVLQAGEMHLSSQPGGDSLFSNIPTLDLGSELAVPIVSEGRPIGLIAVAHARARAFAETDVITLEALAGMLANALRSASLYADVQARIAQLRQAQDQLVQSEKFAAIGRLTASIAHEVNNPLQSIHNCLRLAAEARLAAERRGEYLDMAEAELLRLMEIVRRMLEFYRPAAAERLPASVNRLVEDVLALAGKQIRDAGVLLERHFDPRLPDVRVVANHLRQVFLNLILNAVEAMPAGGVLSIDTASGAAEVLIRFADSGPGLDPPALSQIFEPFYTTKARGTGLGLSVSYGIVAAHGGRIDVESDPGQGAVFTVRLPIEER